MADRDIAIVPVIEPLDLTILSGSRSPAPGQKVTKGIFFHEWVSKYFILITNLLLSRFVGL